MFERDGYLQGRQQRLDKRAEAVSTKQRARSSPPKEVKPRLDKFASTQAKKWSIMNERKQNAEKALATGVASSSVGSSSQGGGS